MLCAQTPNLVSHPLRPTQRVPHYFPSRYKKYKKNLKLAKTTACGHDRISMRRARAASALPLGSPTSPSSKSSPPKRPSPPKYELPRILGDEKRSPFVCLRLRSWLRRHGVGSFWLPIFFCIAVTAPSLKWCFYHALLMVRVPPSHAPASHMLHAPFHLATTLFHPTNCRHPFLFSRTQSTAASIQRTPPWDRGAFGPPQACTCTFCACVLALGAGCSCPLFSPTP
jgi:hypothetical protein